MKKYPNLSLGALVAIGIIVGAYLSNTIGHLRDSERFYRWIITAATQASVLEPVQQEDDGPKMMDKELFDSVVAVADPHLPDLERPLGKDDQDDQGKPFNKLVLNVREFTREKGETEESARQWVMWNLASGDTLMPQRTEFLRYMREKRIGALGTQFDRNLMYGSDSGSISLGNVLLGFRTMAANLIWLQVDKHWHKGQLSRMVPLMKVCVALDPHFIDAFLLGAWHLAYNMTARLPDTPEALKEYSAKYNARIGKKEQLYYQAVEFLKDGIRKNPRNYKLYFDLGYCIYQDKMKDSKNAVTYLSEAMRHRHNQWVPRMLYRSMQLDGQYENALAGWEDYRAKFPDSSVGVVKRSIETNKGLILERNAERSWVHAEQAQKEADKAREAAAQARSAADAARQANNEGEAQKQEALAQAADAVAATADTRAKTAHEESDKLYADARSIWETLNNEGGEEGGGDPFSLGRITRMDARKMIMNKQYHEAIGLLDYARYKSNAFWDEASNMIIEAKQKAGIRLNLSERMEMVRRAEAEKYTATLPKNIRGKTYELKAGTWVEQGYAGEKTTLFTPSADDYEKFPELGKILGLTPRVIFQLGDIWFEYVPPLPHPSGEGNTQAGGLPSANRTTPPA